MTGVWSPRDIANVIAQGDGIWTDSDAVLVAKAYLALAEKDEWRGCYPTHCIDREICRGHTSCPRERSCIE